MKLAPDQLPDDPILLKQMLAAMMEQATQKDTQITTLKAANHHKQVRIDHLELIVKMMQGRQFGRSSEESAQLNLLHEEAEVLEADLAQTQAILDKQNGQTPKSAKPNRTRKPFPAELERLVQNDEPASCDCPACGAAMTLVGEDVSEVLDVVPAKYRVIRMVRPKYGCKGCNQIAQSPAQERVIDRGTATANLIAQVIVDKYADHLPLYRQAERFERSGIDLDRSTQAGWVGRVSGTLYPLVNAIRDHVKAGVKLHADETPAPTLSPGKGKTHTGYYWAYVRDDSPFKGDAAPAVWFQYSDSRKGIEPAKHLLGYSGTIQADAYAGYNTLISKGAERSGCWAHVRRKFVELVKLNPDSPASKVVVLINQLYEVERTIKGIPPEERMRRRRELADPILDNLKALLDEQIKNCLKKSPLANAIQYARKQWDELVRYVDDGHLEIDNNAAERAIRPLAVGRKNHLFAGSAAGGETGAIMYTLMGTAKLNGMDPLAYLTAVLKRINNTPITEVAALLPWTIDLNEAKYAEAI